jgi:hypothetical protein
MLTVQNLFEEKATKLLPGRCIEKNFREEQEQEWIPARHCM